MQLFGLPEKLVELFEPNRDSLCVSSNSVHGCMGSEERRRFEAGRHDAPSAVKLGRLGLLQVGGLKPIEFFQRKELVRHMLRVTAK